MDTRRPRYETDSAYYSADVAYGNRGMGFFRRISWGAIFAGALVAIVVMLLLNLLGIGIGLGSINPVEESNAFSGLGTGAIIWWVVSNLIAIFAGGYVAGRLAGVPLRTASTLHGILAWCLYTLVSFWILTTAIGSIISGVGSIMSGAISAAGSGIEAVSGNSGNNQDQNSNQQASISFAEIQREVRQVLSQTGDPALQPDSIEQTAQNTAQNARQTLQNTSYVSDEELTSIVENVMFQGGQLVENIDRQDVVNVVVQRTNLSRQEANNVADVVVRKHQQAKQNWKEFKANAKQEAEQKGQQVADSASKAAIWSFVALFLGAVVAGVGGGVGKPHEVVVAPDAKTDVVK
ncbi:hypothetical protein [Cesiribacter sp. SM1]|uniref:hypothetical protein n=1 Tax=Cesiribacter sp. SM1 TaxID=2861196 RepID=UPI001CD1A86A|nr:hypothetical protein [Cesiribacter sp. SM1]